MRIFSNGGANTDYGLLIQAGEDDPDDGTPGGSGMAAGDIRWLGLAAGDGILQSKLQFLDSGVYSALVSGSDERMKDNITDTDVSGLEIIGFAQRDLPRVPSTFGFFNKFIIPGPPNLSAAAPIAAFPTGLLIMFLNVLSNQPIILCLFHNHKSFHHIVFLLLQGQHRIAP